MKTNARMPSLPVDVVDVEGGFVGASDVLDEMIRVGFAPATVGGVGAGVAQDVAPTTNTAPIAADAIPPPTRVARAMRCNNNTSSFVLRRMAQLVSDGSRLNKVFKDKNVNHVAKALKEVRW